MSMELSDELSERYTKANGPQIYQLNRDLALLSQQNDPVTLYYSKMKKIWDELRALEGSPQCTCGVFNNCTCNLIKRFQDLHSRRKLIQFLIGLNSRYEAARNQILAMDPLPSVGRAYCIILQAEKQNKATDSMTAKHELEAHALQKEGSIPASSAQKDVAQVSRLDAVEAPTGEQSCNTALVDAVCQQVLKALKGMQIGLPVNNSSSASSSNTFAGDSMAEDPMQAEAATPMPVFDLSPMSGPPLSGSIFDAAPFPFPSPSRSPALTPGCMGAPFLGNPFQLGSQPNQMPPPQNPSAFQPSSSVNFHAGSTGSFSLGCGGGDKANRRIVKVKSKMRRK